MERGQVLCKPELRSSRTPSSRAEAYILTRKEEGGRSPTPVPSRTTARSSYFRTTDVTGTVQLPDGTEMVMPGDNLKVHGSS